MIESITKLTLIGSKYSRPLVPYLRIKGPITSRTYKILIYISTNEVNDLLNRIPKNSKKIALVINSHGGSMAQALIIAEKLKRKAK